MYLFLIYQLLIGKYYFITSSVFYYVENTYLCAFLVVAVTTKCWILVNPYLSFGQIASFAVQCSIEKFPYWLKVPIYGLYLMLFHLFLVLQ